MKLKHPQTNGTNLKAANSPAAWDTVAFPKAIRDPRVGKENQILSSEIKSVGRFPVIDQGQSFVAGYSDEETRVIRDDLPLVIFGDHTRVVKFVDFPFILGADGTKVLKPRENLFDARFFALVLQHLNIPSRGYNRHFTLLKERTLPKPGLPEQRKIAGVLGLVQRAMEQQERLLALTAELKKALLHQLFTHGLRHEPQKQTELGPLPESWEVTQFSKVAKFQTGGTPSRTNPQYWENGDIPWVKTTEINYKVIEATEEKITRLGLENSAAKVFPAGTLLVAMYGQGITRGRVGLLGINAATNQACAAITPYDERKIMTRFIYYFLEFHYESLRQMGHGANQRNLNLALLKGFSFAYPKPDEQIEICQALTTLDSKVELHRRKHATLSALFHTLLHELMTARIRVHNLDLPELETATRE